jgi:hypothetical protein
MNIPLISNASNNPIVAWQGIQSWFRKFKIRANVSNHVQNIHHKETNFTICQGYKNHGDK